MSDGIDVRARLIAGWIKDKTCIHDPSGKCLDCLAEIISSELRGVLPPQWIAIRDLRKAAGK